MSSTKTFGGCRPEKRLAAHIPFDLRREWSMHPSQGACHGQGNDEPYHSGFAADIASKLDEAAIIARLANDFGQKGLPERAFQSLLEIEQLVHEASILLNATSVVRRRERRGIASD